MIVNPTIKSLLFSECRSHKNTYKTPYDKYRSRPEKYILNRRVLLDILASMARDQVTTTHHYSHTIYLAWLVLVSAVSRPQWMLMDPTLVEPTAVRLK